MLLAHKPLRLTDRVIRKDGKRLGCRQILFIHIMLRDFD